MTKNKKRLDVAAITDELKHSAFFPAAHPPTVLPVLPVSQVTPAQPEQAVPLVPLAPPSVPPSLSTPTTTEPAGNREEPQSQPQPQPQPYPMPKSPFGATSSIPSPAESPIDPATMLPDQQPAPPVPHVLDMLDSTSASMLAGMDAVIEAIRKAVRHVGKEVSFVRLTHEEKRQLADIAYTYKSQGIKTSENEISRIGINWMLEDYHANGQTSVLAQVIAALNA